jgi:hypothetical protein
MINRSPQLSALRSGLLIENKRRNAYFSVAIILLTGCSATQVRWDATKMRKDVMVYYNDQIMDNLIRAYNRLPFVHVDITLLTSQGGSQISGTIGGGETHTHQNSPVGVLANVFNTVARPFSYSVTPQQTETLTISTAPAIGTQTVAAPEPIPWPTLQVSKYTDSWEVTQPTPSPGTQSAEAPSPTKKHITTAEEQPIQRTIYDLYENFADGYVQYSPTRPNNDEVLPGTVIKLWGGYYYYIVKGKEAQDAYYKFCKALFTKGQAGLLGSAVQQGLAAPLAVPTFR